MYFLFTLRLQFLTVTITYNKDNSLSVTYLIIISAGGSSNFECSATYMGSKPASEIEIKNMQDHVSAIRDRVKVFMDVHAYSQYWMYPYGHSDVLLPADDDELVRVFKYEVN